MKALKDTIRWLVARYDKVIAVVVFLALTASLLYLALRIGTIQRMDAEFQRKLDKLKPRYPEAEAVSEARHMAAMSAVTNPLSFREWTTALTIPEIRVWCVDCMRPIPFSDMVCSFCGADQPQFRGEIEGLDSDGDGIPDKIEILFGLDPHDPADAHEDMDGDGFTNLEEYVAGTDMRDPDDFPPVEPYLEIEKIAAEPFLFLFKSYMKVSGDVLTFALNTRDGGRTYFLRLGDVVEGFLLDNFEQKFDVREAGSMGVRDDKSELTLTKADQKIVLIRGRDVKFQDYTAHVVYRRDGRRFECRHGDTIALRDGREYRVLHIDSSSGTVVIRRMSDGIEFSIGGRKAEDGVIQ